MRNKPPVTETTTIVLLLACLAMMGNDPQVGHRTLLLIPLIAIMIVGGWYALRRRTSRDSDQELSRLTK
ncbi:hypothetical protein AB0O67_14615 [Streptomyces sp. NPDC086077]|uniref:hypothetical protein n=1 Tax=Streptomyces sp. NPDC086077 TaxID=3154862 RepID=UPI00342CBA59